ncbi:dUTP diphosphatase [Bacillus sp. FSL W8-0519]|uniref:dUTP diphosphatase n=1 Tax=Bacillus sp. FSL W8-0519 TaxID=2954624 RepID=UPI000936FDE4
MNLPQLFQMQKVLDERIVQEHGIEGKVLLLEKVVALRVELAELANETRCFKYWSDKPASGREIILEEYVDGLHFILSIGLELGVDKSLETLDIKPFFCDKIAEQFNKLFILEWNFKFDYEFGLDLFIALGEMLGFTWGEIAAAYLEKNKVNHQRQDDGY